MRVFADYWVSLEIAIVNGQDIISPFLYPPRVFSNQVGNDKIKVADFEDL